MSKPAIRAAAKRYPQVNFCVASSQRLPFSDASFDAVVRIYAPCNAEELARVVRPGGWVITATPGPRHLLELKGLIYDEVRLHELKTEAMPGFRTEAQQQLAYPMILTGSEAQALLQMTPFAWRAKAEVHATLRQQPTFLPDRFYDPLLAARSVKLNRRNGSRGFRCRCQSARYRREFRLVCPAAGR